MNLDPLRDELDEAAAAAGLGVGERPWVLFGSVVLLLYGLRHFIGDVDVFVDPAVSRVLATRPAWTTHTPDPDDPPFLERTVDGETVHVFADWTSRDPEVSPTHCRAAGVLVHGWWCTPLQIIRMHKAMSVAKHAGAFGQAKHLPDIAAIDELAALDYPGPRYAWVRRDVEALPVPVRCRGARRLFTIDDELLTPAQGTLL